MDIWVVLVIILVAVIVWRGPKTLPQLGRAFGRGVREAREEAAKAQAEIQTRTTTDPEERGDTATAAAPVGTTTTPTAPPAPPAAPPATPPTPPTAPPSTPPTDPTPPSAS